MPSEQPASTPPAEFRRYRRFLSWLVLGFVSLGSAYMLVSVGVTIYRRRNAVPSGAVLGFASYTASVLRNAVERLARAVQDLSSGRLPVAGEAEAPRADRWTFSGLRSGGNSCRGRETEKLSRILCAT